MRRTAAQPRTFRHGAAKKRRPMPPDVMKDGAFSAARGSRWSSTTKLTTALRTLMPEHPRDALTPPTHRSDPGESDPTRLNQIVERIVRCNCTAAPSPNPTGMAESCKTKPNYDRDQPRKTSFFWRNTGISTHRGVELKTFFAKRSQMKRGQGRINKLQYQRLCKHFIPMHDAAQDKTKPNEGELRFPGSSIRGGFLRPAPADFRSCCPPGLRVAFAPVGD